MFSKAHRLIWNHTIKYLIQITILVSKLYRHRYHVWHFYGIQSCISLREVKERRMRDVDLMIFCSTVVKNLNYTWYDIFESYMQRSYNFWTWHMQSFLFFRWQRKLHRKARLCWLILSGGRRWIAICANFFFLSLKVPQWIGVKRILTFLFEIAGSCEHWW